MKERVKNLRKKLGLNQTQFGERIGVKQTTIAGYETGARIPLDTVIASICKEYNVNEKWLCNGTGNMFVQLSKEDNNLSDTDRNLINKYNQLPFSERKIVDEILDALLIKSQIESK